MTELSHLDMNDSLITMSQGGYNKSFNTNEVKLKQDTYYNEIYFCIKNAIINITCK